MIRFFAFFMLFCTACWAETVDTYPFQHEADRIRAVALAKTLRCVQCQNQNLVESNAQAAFELRQEVYQMVESGKSNEAIKAELVRRYGDFVLYQPPVNWKTYALWGVPPLVLLLALGIVWRNVRRSTGTQAGKNQENFTRLSASHWQTAEAGKNSLNFPRPFGQIGAIVLFVFVLPSVYYWSTGRWQVAQQGSVAFQHAMAQRANQDQDARQITLAEAIQNRLRQNPNDGQSWFELGQIYAQQAEFDDALECYARASQLLGRKPMILGAAASALYYRDHQLSPQAKAWMEEALKHDPNESASLALLAAQAFAKQDYDHALALWQQMLDSGRTDIDRRAIIQAMENTERLKAVGARQ